MNNAKYYLLNNNTLCKEEDNKFFIFKNNDWFPDKEMVTFNAIACQKTGISSIIKEISESEMVNILVTKII